MSKDILEAVESTRATYEQVAAEYDSITSQFHLAVMYPKIVAAAEDFLGSLGGLKLLDIGCGSGGLMQVLEARGAVVDGIDITPAFLRVARSRGLSVTDASMHALPFGEETFHGVVSNFTLNYLPTTGQHLAIREAYRVLQPGGTIVFSYMHPHLMRTEKYFEPLRQKTIDLLGQKFILHLLDWPEVVNMVVENGFTLRRLIDAEIPANLEKITAQIGDEKATQFAKGFAHTPYGMFVIATK